MEIKRLAGKACKTTRPLWEEIFTEDSPQFVDYYYAKKAADNIAYVSGEEPYEAMLFRTPYPVQIYDKTKELSYIVGVATKEEFRHKGRMTALLMKAMEEMYAKRQPFSFLMPANPAIYEPFDFRYVYERPQWSFQDKQFPMEVLEPLMGTKKTLRLSWEEFTKAPDLQAAGMKKVMPIKENQSRVSDLQAGEKDQPAGELFSMRGYYQEPLKIREMGTALADFANTWLEERYQIYVKRDADYYERQLSEIQAQNGDIFVLKRGESLEGFFLYAREGEEIFVQEMMERQPGSFSFLEEKKEKKPVIMARIIHLEEMMKLVKSPHNRTILLEVEDPLLPQNDGLYLWELTPFGSRVTRQREVREGEIFMTIDELTPHLIQGVFLNEIV